VHPSCQTLCRMTNLEPDASRGGAESALHDAAWSGDLQYVTQLVEAGAEVNWRDSIGESALFGAAAWGHVDVVRYLLSVGARHDLLERTGYTPLHWAASHGTVATLEVLVAAGADPMAQDNHGRTPLDVARNCNKGENVAYLAGLREGKPKSSSSDAA
jgi:uncharacterized protein